MYESYRGMKSAFRPCSVNNFLSKTHGCCTLTEAWGEGVFFGVARQ